MGFAIILSTVIGLTALALSYSFFRRRRWIAPVLACFAFTASLAWFLLPVCVLIPPEDIASFNPPIETRTETGILGQRYFEERNGGWFHCKARIARKLFF
ncbi:hypothetical protein [Limibacillus halophilus]|uniref:Uncharacterized protein n=1 Tax=Limibacillus halophilus TaxID=1579333 RepID=A0A839SUM3_9PROT|nr:hypothetical protein [Limibacillus halophilus]MBB3065380.1 hypothetical protein [Limibacillus halophilus]